MHPRRPGDGVFRSEGPLYLVAGAGSADNGSFTISGNELKTAESFNFEAKASYSIRVKTTDSGSAGFEKQLTITVENVNDPPTNILLSKQFDVFAFPTFVAMDDAGQEIWRMPAKDDPNPGIDTRLFKPSEFIALIESVKAKRK